MNPLLIATAVATQCVVTPFSVGGVPMLCKSCAKNGITTSVICVPIKEKSYEKSNRNSLGPIGSDRVGGLHQFNFHLTGWSDGGVHYLLRL